MNIFHGPVNIGQMAYTLAKYQRKLGHNALSYSFSNDSIYKFKIDKIIETNGLLKKISYLKELITFPFKFDIFHFYFGQSLTKERLSEVPVLKRYLKKKIFFYFCGCDIRDAKIVITKYKYSACKVCWPASCSANRDLAKEIAIKYADKIFVSTLDLLEFLPSNKTLWLPQPIDLEQLYQEASKITDKDDLNSKEITIVHSPSAPLLKGTSYIIKAIENLKKKYKINFILLTNKPYKEVLRINQKADIIIDQLLVGWYGQYSVEAMALNKIVVVYIRDNLETYIDKYRVPIVNANIENIEQILEDIIKNKDKYQDIANKGKEFVKKIHSAEVVAKRALEVYENA